MKWRPIETAPEAQWVLVTWEGGQKRDKYTDEFDCWDYGYCQDYPAQPMMAAIFIPGEHENAWRAVSFDGGFFGELKSPTHWRSLPDGLVSPDDQRAVLEAGRDIKARLRSEGIREFCERAGIAASVEALNLPDDVKIFRMASAIKYKEGE